MTSTDGTAVTDYAVATLEGIGKTYRQGRRLSTVLQDVQLTIEEGEFLAIRGPSGSGKSTLVRILGLLDTPTAGSIELFGAALPSSDRALSRLRNRALGFVFQDYRLIPHYSALQNVAVPLKIAGEPRRRQKARATELLELLGLGDSVRLRPGQLSGGQQQRVGIARALALDPRILIADEPTGNLDSATGATIMNVLEEIHTRLGTTIVMVTHSREVAARAGRLLTLRDGRLEED